MNYLDVIVSPFSQGDSATAIFAVGAGTVALICGLTATVIALRFRSAALREEKKKERKTVSEGDGE